MSTGFNFKLDPSSLPKLDAKGDNFLDWKAAWARAFRFAELDDILSGVKVKPEDREDRKAWDKQDDQAFVMLLSAVHSDLTTFIANCSTASDAWTTLENRFDRDTGNSTIYLFRTLTNLRYADGDNLMSHLDDFRQIWTKLYTRTSNSSQSIGKAMKAMFDSDEVKGSFFLTTLPDTLDHVVDNLSSQGLTKFSQIEPKILDIASRKTEDDPAAYYTQTGRRNQQRNTGRRDTREKPKDKGCTWCRSKNYKFVGHSYTDCDKLAQYKKKRNDKDKANAAGDDDDSGTDTVAFAAADDFRTPKTSWIPTCLDDVQSKDVTAFAVRLPREPREARGAWIFDSGASKHMSGQADDFVELTPRTGTITIANGHAIAVEGVGTVELTLKLPDGATRVSRLSNVLFSRHLKQTRLFSWTTIRKNYVMDAKDDNIYLRRFEDGEIVLWAKFFHGVFEIQATNDMANFVSYQHFHNALGHSNVSQATARRIYEDGDLVPKMPMYFGCGTCSVSKSTRDKPKSCPPHQPRGKFGLVHSDLSGRFSVKSIGGAQYFISFIEEDTRHAWVYFLKTKKQAAHAADTFFAYVETQFGIKIKALASDNGGEYIGAEMTSILKKRGITHRKSAPYHHESNGLPERFNRTIITDARTMIDTEDHLYLWPEAVSYAVYLRNRKPHSRLPCHMTPYEALYEQRPKIGHLQPFMQPCFVHIPVEARKSGTKLHDRAEKGCFVGMENNSTSVCRIFIPLRKAITTAAPSHLKWERYASPNINWSVTFPDQAGTPCNTEVQASSPTTDASSSSHSVPTAAPKSSASSHDAVIDNNVSQVTKQAARTPSATRSRPAEVSSSRRTPAAGSSSRPTPGGAFGTRESAISHGSPAAASPSQPDPAHGSPRGTTMGYSSRRNTAMVPGSGQKPTQDSAPRQTRSGRKIKPTDKTRGYKAVSFADDVDVISDAEDVCDTGLGCTVRDDGPSGDRDIRERLRKDFTEAEMRLNMRGIAGLDSSRHPGDTSNIDTVAATALIAVEGDDIPMTYGQATRHADHDSWMTACENEINSHVLNGTFEEVHMTQDMSLVNPRWVFAKKYNDVGELLRYKARLVARGFTQVHGVNYDDTYSPVARYDSLRLLICLAAWYGWTLYQMDVETAYLHSRLKHEVYMRPPPGYNLPEGMVLKVLKALYGLKQSGREWFGTLHASLITQSTPTSFDPCVFVGVGFILAVYVDDILITGPNSGDIRKFLAKTFRCKDMGPCRYFLGLQINQTAHGIRITQNTYAQRILSRFGMGECNPRQTPCEPNTFPRKQEEGDIPADTTVYQSITGSLNFLVTGTRPDLAFTCAMLATFNSCATERHMVLVRQVLRYLKYTINYGLFYGRSSGKEDVNIAVYADASYNSDPDTARAFAGYILVVNGKPASWGAKKQTSVAKSTAEAEYMGASTAASHLLWTIQALSDLKVPHFMPVIYCDNEPAIALAGDERINSRTKHIAVHYHFVRERLHIDYVMQHVASNNNLADICTKALPRPYLEQLTKRLFLEA